MKPGTVSRVFNAPEEYTSEETIKAILTAYKSRAWEKWDINPIDNRVLWTFDRESQTVRLYWREVPEVEIVNR